jgi:predicted esterase
MIGVCDELAVAHTLFVLRANAAGATTAAVEVERKECAVVGAATAAAVEAKHKREVQKQKNKANVLKQQKPKKTMAAKRKLKILAMHGYGQTTKTFREKTGALRSAIKSIAEIVYLDAPFDAKAFDGAQTDQGLGKSWYNWWESFESQEEGSGEVRYTGLEETIAAVNALHESEMGRGGGFDGILGFSQGAGTAAVLCAMNRQNRRKEEDAQGQNKDTVLPEFQFAIFFAGFLPRDQEMLQLFDEHDGVPCGVPWLPSLHVMGNADELIRADRSMELAKAFSQPGTPTIVHHEKGHLVPANIARKDFKQFVKEQHVRLLEEAE